MPVSGSLYRGVDHPTGQKSCHQERLSLIVPPLPFRRCVRSRKGGLALGFFPGRLDLLPHLFSEVVVPSALSAELAQGRRQRITTHERNEHEFDLQQVYVYLIEDRLDSRCQRLNTEQWRNTVEFPLCSQLCGNGRVFDVLQRFLLCVLVLFNAVDFALETIRYSVIGQFVISRS